jgi:hypothetical protein
MRLYADSPANGKARQKTQGRLTFESFNPLWGNSLAA